jgi:DNA-directed RNA polymerase specialized sigma24 family protein
MRDRGQTRAWRAFHTRFHRLLEAHARRQRIPAEHWPVCITEVLDDEALRLASRQSLQPLDLPAYLVRASHHRYLRIKRAEVARARVYGWAGETVEGGDVVASTCSQASLAASAGPESSTPHVSPAVRRLTDDLTARLSPEDRLVLVWLGERVSHRQIAEWLGISYAACTKRIWRLCRRLRTRAIARAGDYSSDDRRALARVLRGCAAFSEFAAFACGDANSHAGHANGANRATTIPRVTR